MSVDCFTINSTTEIQGQSKLISGNGFPYDTVEIPAVMVFHMILLRSLQQTIIVTILGLFRSDFICTLSYWSSSY